MKTFHITYFLNRGDVSGGTPLLGAITIEAENIDYALLQYRVLALEDERLPSLNEIKYIIEL